METVAVVLYRHKSGGKWSQQSNGVFEGSDAERLAKNFVECLNNNQGDSFVHVYIAGPITNPAEMAEQEAAL